MALALVLSLLNQASLAYQNVPFWVLVTAHSLTVVTAYRGYSPYWLVSWLLGFLGAFGGGMTSALLLQNPSVAALGLFARNEVGLYYTLTWWAVNYAPGGWGARLAALPPIQAAAKVLRAVLRANTVVQRVDAAVRLHPGVVAAPIVLGTLSACGGTLLVDAFRHCAGYKQGPNELSHPGHALRSAALGALCHYLLVHVAGLLSSQQGLGLVVSLYVLHSLAADLTGQPCDYTAPLGWLFHTVTRIPTPEAAEQAAAAAKAAKAVNGKSPRAGRRRSASPASSGGQLSADERTPGSIFVRRSTRQRNLAAAAAH